MRSRTTNLLEDFVEDGQRAEFDQVQPDEVEDPLERLGRHGVQVQRGAALLFVCFFN